MSYNVKESVRNSRLFDLAEEYRQKFFDVDLEDSVW